MITPFMIMYALHDAVVKPMPGQPKAPSLSESWTMSRDGLVYEFVLRKGARFHNGEPVTAEDVKFSFDRYRGTSARALKEQVAAVEVVDAQHIRFRLKRPWPDFLTFYSSTTGAGWIVPKKYVEQVGEECFKKAPIGAGPYRFVSFTPGVELVFEAFEGYWRKTPSVKRLVFRVIPDETTRLAALKRGEVDIVYSIRGELAEELKRSPGLSLKAVVLQGTYWIYFADQWDAKSPWRDQRVRQAASLAINRPGINEALTLGFSKITGSIIPTSFEYFWQPPAPVFDRAAAKKLLAAAGYPNGFDAGEYFCDATYANLGEAVINDLQSVGIRAALRPLERAAFFSGYGEKKFKNLIQGSSGAFGNAATQLEASSPPAACTCTGPIRTSKGSSRSRPSTPTPSAAATLQRIQQIVHERVVYAPIWQLGFINGVGPRVQESGLGLIGGHAYSAPYEDVTLKSR
jgi:peptide/nickel transport system substrate-binding protein